MNFVSIVVFSQSFRYIDKYVSYFRPTAMSICCFERDFSPFSVLFKSSCVAL